MLSIRNAAVTLSNGVQMPRIGLGVYQSPAGAKTENAVKYALAAGYRHIDTAMLYKNEESVGAGIRASGVPRDEVFVTTKLWNTDHGYDRALQAFEESRKRLGLDYVDLYLIHWPKSKATIEKEGKKTYLETWRAFEKLYEEKKVRAIGVSNFKEHHLDDLLKEGKVAPMVNQVELHPLNSQVPIRKYCASRNIQVQAWSPLGEGKLVPHPTLKAIAEKYNKTTIQVILRWDLQNNVIAIPKSTRQDRIESNANVFDFELSDEDMKTIDAMNENHRFGPDPDTAEF